MVCILCVRSFQRHSLLQDNRFSLEWLLQQTKAIDVCCSLRQDTSVNWIVFGLHSLQCCECSWCLSFTDCEDRYSDACTSNFSNDSMDCLLGKAQRWCWPANTTKRGISRERESEGDSKRVKKKHTAFSHSRDSMECTMVELVQVNCKLVRRN